MHCWYRCHQPLLRRYHRTGLHIRMVLFPQLENLQSEVSYFCQCCNLCYSSRFVKRLYQQRSQSESYIPVVQNQDKNNNVCQINKSKNIPKKQLVSTVKFHFFEPGSTGTPTIFQPATHMIFQCGRLFIFL